MSLGGRPFTAKRTTLQFVPDSMLAKLFDEESPFGADKDDDDRVFIDRDPELFVHVLDYLRTGGHVVFLDALSASIPSIMTCCAAKAAGQMSPPLLHRLTSGYYAFSFC
jgi:hypothetical protein